MLTVGYQPGILHSVASCASFQLLWCHGRDRISREISLVWKYSVSFMLSDYQLSMVKKDRDQDRCLTLSSPGRTGLVCTVCWFPWCKCSSTMANFNHQFVRASVSWLWLTYQRESQLVSFIFIIIIIFIFIFIFWWSQLVLERHIHRRIRLDIPSSSQYWEGKFLPNI